MVDETNVPLPGQMAFRFMADEGRPAPPAPKGPEPANQSRGPRDDRRAGATKLTSSHSRTAATPPAATTMAATNLSGGPS